jgi:hypothetical protein
VIGFSTLLCYRRGTIPHGIPALPIAQPSSRKAAQMILHTLLATALMSAQPGAVQSPQPSLELPALHQIKTVTLAPSYSCRSAEEFAKGYEKTALFLSEFARRRNGPDLLFNGACGAEGVFEAATAGDDMSLIADLGTGISLDEISASQAFNVRRVHAQAAYSKFARVAKVEQGHTYAVLLNSSDKRGLFLVSVTEYVPGKQVTLRYAVKSYQVTPGGQISSPGFHWNRANGR